MVFAIDPIWTEKYLLTAFQHDEADNRDAAWSGFLWGGRVPDCELFLRLKSNLLAFAVDPLPSRRKYTEVTVGIILAGWGSVDPQTSERYISDAEMRNLLLNVDDELRSRPLWQAKAWSTEKRESAKKWAEQIPELLRTWPRQLSVKSPNSSARLCDLAFASGAEFPAVAELILPLLTKIERNHVTLPELRRSGASVVAEQLPGRLGDVPDEAVEALAA